METGYIIDDVVLFSLSLHQVKAFLPQKFWFGGACQ